MKNIKEQFLYDTNESFFFAEFLYGSQNYGLDTEESDVDTKVIVIPSFKELIDRKSISKSTESANGLCDIKDIKTMFEQFIKANPAYIEILATDYYNVNPLYETEVSLLLSNVDEIINRDMKRLVCATYGTALNKIGYLVNNSGTNKEAIKKYGYDGKNPSHVLRLNEFIKRILDGDTLKEALNARKYDNFDTIMAIKNHELPKEEVLRLCQAATKNMCDLADRNYKDANKDIDLLLDDISYSAIQKSVMEELRVK